MQNTLNTETSSYAQSVKKKKTLYKVSKITSKTFIYIVLTIFAIFAIFPFLFMILASFMSNNQFNNFPVDGIIPESFSWANYIDALTYTVGGMNFTTAFINTILVASVSTFLGMVVLIFSAFSFARLNFKGKNLIFTLLLATMMIPGELFTITNYLTIGSMKAMNTLTALIIPFMVSVYYIYLLRNAFMQIPDTLYKAAKVDGVSDFKYLMKVMIPLAMPTIISIIILKFIAVWNSYIWPALVNNSGYMKVLSNWMMASGVEAMGDAGITIYPIRMAAAVVVTIPLLIIFLCARKYVMSGISKSGIKG